jgi:hypothetical protein
MRGEAAVEVEAAPTWAPVQGTRRTQTGIPSIMRCVPSRSDASHAPPVNRALIFDEVRGLAVRARDRA